MVMIYTWLGAAGFNTGIQHQSKYTAGYFSLRIHKSESFAVSDEYRWQICTTSRVFLHISQRNFEWGTGGKGSHLGLLQPHTLNTSLGNPVEMGSLATTILPAHLHRVPSAQQRANGGETRQPLWLK